MKVNFFFVAAVLVAPIVAHAGGTDLETVRQRWSRAQVPAETEALRELRQVAQRAGNTLREDGSWADIDYADQARSLWLAEQHLDRTLRMARAYSLMDARSRDAVEMRGKIVRALDWWLQHDLKNPNWWHNEIGVPLLVGGTALLIGEPLTDLQRTQIDRIMQRSKWEKWTGQNLVWGVSNQVMRGLLNRDQTLVGDALARLYDEVKITSDEGIQRDFSFHQHGAQLYNGGYGLNYATDVPRLVSFAWGTPWQIPDEKARILVDYLLEGERWMMRFDRIDYSTVGREITRRGKTAVPRSATSGPIPPVGAAYGLVRSVGLLAEREGVPRREELLAWIRTMNGDEAAQRVAGNRMFRRSDYMVHQRPGWMASVKMLSSRMLNAELVNGEGTKSQHLSDGANFLYLSGNEYMDIFAVWDWNKVPGTTVENRPFVLDKPTGLRVRGKTKFVGGVSDGTYGVATMDVDRDGVSARKAWVFFDDCYVCLGAGISCESEHVVTTSINQCLLEGKVSEGATWVQHGNVGYIVPKITLTLPSPGVPGEGTNVKMTAGAQEGRWSDIGTGSAKLERRDVFDLWIEHGVRPRDATYQYIVLPGASSTETARWAEDSPVEVVRNTKQQQAVFHRGASVLAISFWEAGKITVGERTIEADQPCLVLVRGAGEKTRIAVADPTQALSTVTVKVDGKSREVKLPSGDGAGSSVAVQ